MKIRQGFFSNSSSSSFIIVVGADDMNYDAIKERLFGDETTINPKYYDGFDTATLTNILVRDIKEAYDNTTSGSHAAASVLEEMTASMCDYRQWDTLSETHTSGDSVSNLKKIFDGWNKYEDEMKGKARLKLAEIEKANPGKRIVTISMSDNDGSHYSYLEHGGLIERIWPDTIKVSHH